MSHWLKFSFGLAGGVAGFLVWSAATHAASAEAYRVPKAGNPGLVAQAPPGWTGRYDMPNEVTISSPDNMAILEVELISDAATAAKPLPDVARLVLRSADLSPRWTSTEPESVAGLEGQAFIVPIARDGVPVGLAHLVIAKIDAGHVVRVTEITLPKETPAEEAATLKDVVSHLSISGR